MVILDQINRKVEASVESGSGWVYVNPSSNSARRQFLMSK